MMNGIEMMKGYMELGLSKEEAMEMVKAEMATATKGKKKSGTDAKAPEFKVKYDHFELKGNGWEATTVASKQGNPDAVLTVTFEEKDDKKNGRLKAAGFRWNSENHYWFSRNGKWEQYILGGLDIE